MSINKLPLITRTQIPTLLCEGTLTRSISRISDVPINTVSRLPGDIGEFCSDLHNREVQNVKALHGQCDEVWLFTAAAKVQLSLALQQPQR